MPIDVTCPGCRKMLRAPDTLAGKRVKCPQCGGAIAVPAPQPAAAPPAFGAVADLIDEAIQEEITKRKAAEEAEYERQQEEEIRKVYESPKAQAAEKREKGLSRIRPRPLVVGRSFNRAWSTLLSNYGLCLGTGITYTLGGLIPFYVVGVASLIFANRVTMYAMEDTDLLVRLPVGILILVVGYVLLSIVPSWLQAGLTSCYLKLAKAEPASYVDMFRPGVQAVISVLGANLCLTLLALIPFLGPITVLTIRQVTGSEPSHYWNYASNAFLVGTAIAVGYFMFRMAFYAYAILDLKIGGADAFGISLDITKGGIVSLFVFMLIMGALAFAGNLIACVGFHLFSFPLIQMSLAVAYTDMTGQRPRKD